MVKNKLNSCPVLERFELFENILTLTLNFDTETKIISFEDFFSMRIIQEGNALKILEVMQFDGENWIFDVNDSEYLEWFEFQSYNIHSELNVKHYMVVTLEYILEVVTQFPPEIKRNPCQHT